MTHTRGSTRSLSAHIGPPVAVALRRTFRLGYGLADLRSDILAGLVVGVIALPLSMALAVASGVPPQHGLYTAIIAGGLIALLGGSKVQVSGPTAAFVVILAPISAKFGLGGLLLATLLAGTMLLLFGMSRMGRFIEFIPYPVTTGFTAGIAVVIATLQVKDFLGLQIGRMPEHYWDKLAVLYQALPTVHWPDLAIGIFTLALLLLLPRLTQRIPAPIIALPLAALAAALLPALGVELPVETIRSRFPETNGIPQTPPLLLLPWMQAGSGGVSIGHQLLDGSVLQALLASAFAIALLGAIESLLSAVVADGMTGKRHDPDSELVAQGIGNIVAPFFGGFAATGAIARTATNIRYGARSPLAAVTHSLFVLLVMVSAAPLLGYLPMAAMAAMLLVVARNMAEIKHFLHILRVAPRSDILVLLTCFSLTVAFDMVVSVTVGVVLAALLFMGRMAEASQVTLVGQEHDEAPEPLPKGMLLYRVAGPLFFGAAQRAMGALNTVDDHVRVLVLDLRDVPTMDATGLVALESALAKLHRRKIFVVIAGVQEQPLHLMAKAGWKHRPWLVVWRNFQDALALARSLSPSDFDSVGQLSEVQ
jgi:SulP family sulfate permease